MNIRTLFLAVTLLFLAAWGVSQVAETYGPLAAVAVLLAVNALPTTFMRQRGVFGVRQYAPIPDFESVGAGLTARTKLPRNRRYFGLTLQYKTNDSQANIQAALTQIRILVNEKVVRVFSATQLFTMLAANSRAFTLGCIPIHFAEPYRRTPEGEEYLALNAWELLGVGDVKIEVDIAGGAAAPTLSGVMCYDYERPADVWADIILPNGQPAVPGASDAMKQAAFWKRSFMHWLPRAPQCTAAATAAAPLTPADFMPNVNGYFHRAHIFDAVVTDVVLRNGETPFWRASTVNLAQMLINSGMAKQASTFHIVVDSDQQYVDGLYIPSVGSLKTDFITSGAGSGNVLTSILEIRKPLDNAA